jgi:hypothetical protein
MGAGAERKAEALVPGDRHEGSGSFLGLGCRVLVLRVGRGRQNSECRMQRDFTRGAPRRGEDRGQGDKGRGATERWRDRETEGSRDGGMEGW